MDLAGVRSSWTFDRKLRRHAPKSSGNGTTRSTSWRGPSQGRGRKARALRLTGGTFKCEVSGGLSSWVTRVGPGDRSAHPARRHSVGGGDAAVAGCRSPPALSTVTKMVSRGRRCGRRVSCAPERYRIGNEKVRRQDHPDGADDRPSFRMTPRAHPMTSVAGPCTSTSPSFPSRADRGTSRSKRRAPAD